MKMSDVFDNDVRAENITTGLNYTEYSVVDGHGLIWTKERAEAAAHAINCHDELVEALEIALESAKNEYACGEDFVERIEAILNKAKGLDND